MSAEDFARWEPRWRSRSGAVGEPEPYLTAALSDVAPTTALDVAAGDGRNALWLARRGFAVTAVDVSPTAIARLEAAAAAEGLTVTGRVADLDAPEALAGLGPFGLLAVARFKPSPGQWARLLDRLAPGGTVLLCSFRAEHHARHGFPLAYCLDRAELEAALGPRLSLEAWQEHEVGDACLAGSLWRRHG